VRRAQVAAVTLAIVDEGYPETARGGALGGLDQVERSGVLVFHAGTRLEGGEWAVRGGRAAYLTAVAESVPEARERVYAARERLSGTGWRCRSDVAAGIAASAPST